MSKGVDTWLRPAVSDCYLVSLVWEPGETTWTGSGPDFCEEVAWTGAEVIMELLPEDTAPLSVADNAITNTK